ncbi:TlpA family protein disulfide reductase [Lacinutrix algicola]|uniref:TlpA family protein disulfide reductase n=1 Tax=Lacinutrix algicola TaxID=342954 RepID=UPI0006E12B08|nr:TlpA disulfide reductase family protein [Lacinutrix algicola]
MKHFIRLLVFAISFTLSAQESLPTTEIKTLDGTTTSLQEISKQNDLIVVSLWATWCVPCKNELDAINELYTDWQDETNVKVYAISIDDSRTVSRVKPLVNGKAWDFDILLDTNNDLKRELGAATVPLTLIIKNGKIVYRHSGYTPGSEDSLFEEIKKHS